MSSARLPVTRPSPRSQALGTQKRRWLWGPRVGISLHHHCGGSLARVRASTWFLDRLVSSLRWKRGDQPHCTVYTSPFGGSRLCPYSRSRYQSCLALYLAVKKLLSTIQLVAHLCSTVCPTYMCLFIRLGSVNAHLLYVSCIQRVSTVCSLREGHMPNNECFLMIRRYFFVIHETSMVHMPGAGQAR